MTEILIHPLSPEHDRITLIISALAGKGITAKRVNTISPDAADPILIFWTRGSVARAEKPDEIILANAEAGRLVSVLIEKVGLPADYPAHPTIDLINWRGSPKNAYFGDLVATLRAAAECRPPPPPRGPVYKFVKRFSTGLTTAAVVAFVFSFFLNVLELQNNLCSIGFVQPTVSDYCGEFGLGGKPTQEERLAWESREPGSCEAIRQHVQDANQSGRWRGAFLERASAILDARRIVVDELWVPDTQRAVFSQSIAPEGAPDEQTARLQAISEGRRLAEASCRAFAESDLYVFSSVELKVDSWDCFSTRSGHFCGFDGYRTCNLDRLVRTNREICGELE